MYVLRNEIPKFHQGAKRLRGNSDFISNISKRIYIHLPHPNFANYIQFFLYIVCSKQSLWNSTRIAEFLQSVDGRVSMEQIRVEATMR